MTEKIKDVRLKIVKILKKKGIARAGIFGSYATGKARKNSDIDILIDVTGKGFSLFDLVALELELQKVLNKKVDLITYKSIHPLLKKRILNEEIKII